MKLKPIPGMRAVKILRCEHNDWIVFRQEKIALREPAGDYVRTHQCPKIDVYRKRMSTLRVYVVKGDLAANIINNAKNKKKEELEKKEAKEHDTEQVDEVEQVEGVE